jgi:hypothetical protein
MPSPTAAAKAVVIMFLDKLHLPRRATTQRRPSARDSPLYHSLTFRDGKPLYRCINEYTEAEFHASRDVPECSIGDSSFKFETAAYGSGYTVSIQMKLSGGRRLEASFEWLSIESIFQPTGFVTVKVLTAGIWSRHVQSVSGKITGHRQARSRAR